MIESFVWSYVTNNISPIEIMDNDFSKLFFFFFFFLKIEAKMSNVYGFLQAHL